MPKKKSKSKALEITSIELIGYDQAGNKVNYRIGSKLNKIIGEVEVTKENFFKLVDKLIEIFKKYPDFETEQLGRFATEKRFRNE